MIIKKFLRRESGIIYKYAHVTYAYNPKSRKAVKREMEDYQLMEGYSPGPGRLREVYRRVFDDFSRDK